VIVCSLTHRDLDARVLDNPIHNKLLHSISRRDSLSLLLILLKHEVTIRIVEFFMISLNIAI